MAMLDHWHPVLVADSLRKQPVGIRLADREIVLFRDGEGRVGALDDICVHRRMRLSCGSVVDGRLQCVYHGWTFDAQGQGESPGTPKLHACAAAFDTCEQHGVIWVKSRTSQPQFPTLDVNDYVHMCTLHHRIEAPLELVVDNFCEIEHTPTTHAIFGYRLEQMHEVSVRFEPTDTTVRVINVGPPKSFGWPLRKLLGIGPNFVFNDDWTTHFSPVYSVYEHFWSDPATGREAMVRWRLYIFFVPESPTTTRLMTLAYARSRYPGPAGGLRLFRWLMRRQLDHEIGLDVRILERLASHNPDIEGMKLSRFDRVLGLNRERIQRVYRGEGNRVRLAA